MSSVPTTGLPAPTSRATDAPRAGGHDADSAPRWTAGPRLRLREFGSGDRSALVRMHADPRVRTLLIDDQPLDRAVVAHAFLERLQAFYRRHEGLGIWHAERLVVRDPRVLEAARVDAAADPSGLADALLAPLWRFCGWFSLMLVPGATQEIELGSRLCTDAWGQGLALDGGEWLLRHAFTTLGRTRVWGVCHPEHRVVRHCLLTLGFAPDGVRDYCGRPASWFVIDPESWAQTQALPRRERVRRAAHGMRRGANPPMALAGTAPPAA